MTPASDAPATIDPAPASNRWILGPLRDVLLFVGTPLLILPAVLGLGAAGVASAAMNKWVMALGGMGHHLPGMMRAYGDRALFARFRTRFVLSPLLLVTACVSASLAGLHVLLLTAYVWGIWHGLMQTHGFMRIYDAKVGSVAARTRWLDFALCVSWFVGGVIFADTRIDYAQEMLLSTGAPGLTAGGVQVVRLVMSAVLAVVTTAWLLNIVAIRRAGGSVSPIKLVLAVTSVGWWWYANVYVADIQLGLILFEVFHDVQYLSIVWLFNSSRVERDPEVGPFSRALFRPSVVLLAVYVGLVFAYGSLGPLSESRLGGTDLGRVAAGLLTASALLHFYYDGFIWKMRESGTAENLGIDRRGGRDTAPGRPSLTTAQRHALKWAAFAVPIVVLGVLELRGAPSEVERARALAALNDDLPSTHVRLARALKDAGDVEGTIAALQSAVALENDAGQASDEALGLLALSQLELGETRLREGRDDEAAALLREAYEIEPNLAHALHQEGHSLLASDPEAAEWRFRAVLAMRPTGNLGPTWMNLALALERQGRIPEALEAARTGSRTLPGDPRVAGLVDRLQAALKR